jgi:hypothetical protein
MMPAAVQGLIMATARDIDSLLKKWQFQPGEVNARLLRARDGREVLQMRVDMGVLQLETDLRPDGSRPHGAETYYDYLVGEAIREGDAFRDADHSLAFMDFVREHSPDEEWTLSHEQYRPFVLFHRVQAGALAALEGGGAEAAIREINGGLERFRDLFARYGAVEQFAEDELVRRLEEMREGVRRKYEVGPTLDERLAEAVRAEDYELAARIRDQIRAGG